MGFFTKTVEREVGHCMYCGKPMIGEFKEKDGSLYNAPDFTLADNTYICKECFYAKSFDSSDFKKKWTKDEMIQKFTKKGIVSPDEFTPTKRVYRVATEKYTSRLPYLEYDESRNLVNIPEIDWGIFGTKYKDFVVPCSTVVGFQVIDDGKTSGNVVSQTAEATADLLSGDFISAAIGALNASNAKKCKELSMKIILDDMNNNTKYIRFIGNGSGVPAIERKSSLYKDIVNQGIEEVASVLTVIMKRNQATTAQAQTAPSTSEDVIGKIKQLAELKEAGIISLSEFEAKKAELMARL